MNIGVHVSLSILVSSVCMPSSGSKISLDYDYPWFPMKQGSKSLKELILDDLIHCIIEGHPGLKFYSVVKD